MSSQVSFWHICEHIFKNSSLPTHKSILIKISFNNSYVHLHILFLSAALKLAILLLCTCLKKNFSIQLFFPLRSDSGVITLLLMLSLELQTSLLWELLPHFLLITKECVGLSWGKRWDGERERGDLFVCLNHSASAVALSPSSTQTHNNRQ